MEWYSILSEDAIDSPALIIYPDHVSENINVLKTMLPDVSRLRPHVKTHKSADVTTLLLAAGITKFKCATISEAEMLGKAGANDVLLAYQPVGPKASRLLALTEEFPDTTYSCLIDTPEVAGYLSDLFHKTTRVLPVYVDLNVGMNRTGIMPADASALIDHCETLPGIRITGVHAYDGHLRDADLSVRAQKCDAGFASVQTLVNDISKKYARHFTVVAGGTPTFPIHARRPGVECSPGTFIYWDIGYQQVLAEQPFLFAALVMTRVISRPAADIICLDLGHKSIASENPLANRVKFLNAELEPIGHSEEHMTARISPDSKLSVGDVLYGVPFHVCPTIALYDSATTVRDHVMGGQWLTVSRKRTITI